MAGGCFTTFAGGCCTLSCRSGYDWSDLFLVYDDNYAYQYNESKIQPLNSLLEQSLSLHFISYLQNSYRSVEALYERCWQRKFAI